jgi:excisionase family DNA binding protein
MNNISEHRFMTPKEVAELLRVTDATVRNLIKSKKIKAIQVNGSRGLIRIPTSEIEKLLNHE